MILQFFYSEQFEDPLHQHIFDNDDDNHDLNDAVRKMIRPKLSINLEEMFGKYDILIYY